jgi:S-formylglutathione hydrolase FrmB
MPFGVTLAAAGVLLIAAAVFVFRKRHARIKARRTWRWTSYVAGSLAVVIGLACAVNAYVGWAPNLEAALIRAGLVDALRPGTVPATAAPQPHELGDQPVTAEDVPIATIDDIPEGLDPDRRKGDRGGIARFTLPVPAEYHMPGSEVVIYTPPGYDPSGKVAYPVLYLAHGAPGSASDWFAVGSGSVVDSLIARRELAPVILVSPGLQAVGASDSGCLDATKPGGSQVESYLHKVVRPWVENHFPVTTDRDFTAIGGMSMGGYCSIDQGLRHADRFATILSILPYGEPGKAGKAMKSNPAEIANVTPLAYIKNLKTLDEFPVAAWFAVDDAEVDKQVGRDAKKMTDALHALGQTAEIYIDEGLGHTWAMTVASLPHGLEFWERQMEESHTAE